MQKEKRTLDEIVSDYAIQVEPASFYSEDGCGYEAMYSINDIKKAFRAGYNFAHKE